MAIKIDTVGLRWPSGLIPDNFRVRFAFEVERDDGRLTDAGFSFSGFVDFAFPQTLASTSGVTYRVRRMDGSQGSADRFSVIYQDLKSPLVEVTLNGRKIGKLISNSESGRTTNRLVLDLRRKSGSVLPIVGLVVGLVALAAFGRKRRA